MIKKIAATVTILLSLTGALSAQSYGYVDLNYMLGNIPEYKAAQNKIDTLSARWQKEIDARYKEIDQLYQSYQTEQVLLTEEMKKQRRQEIEDKEKAAKELQKKHFGYEGDLFKKRDELIKPIQDRIYDAIQKYSGVNHYDMIFDKSSGVTLFYANPKFDVSDKVLVQMGYTPKKEDETKSPKGTPKAPGNNKPGNGVPPPSDKNPGLNGHDPNQNQMPPK